MALPGRLLLLFLTAAHAALQTCGGNQTPGPVANVSRVWSSNTSRDVLLCSVPGNGNEKLSFAAGFYCSSPCDAILFAVYITSGSGDIPVVVWSANRDLAAHQNATLSFTASGDLVLANADGSVVWSTGTSGQFVIGMTITNSGNLVLFNDAYMPVWQSFENPTDSLLPGQMLAEGMMLRPNSSATNWTTSRQLYFTVRITQYQYKPTFVTLVNGSLSIPGSDQLETKLPPAHSLQYLRFESDGHLRLYEWEEFKQRWVIAKDIFELNYCQYPTVCGEYGICLSEGCSTEGMDCSTTECSCPNTTYFKPIDNMRPTLGCAVETEISCQAMQDHQLVAIPNVTYFHLWGDSRGAPMTDEESCKKDCLSNCSCKAALFILYLNQTQALLYPDLSLSMSYLNTCYLLPEVLSLKAYLDPGYYSKDRSTLKRCNRQRADESDFADLPGTITRFTFKMLKAATNDFSSKLGEGGFGSVFLGKLGNEMVAVKLLDRAGQGKKDFLAEVQTIGNIHHINLVKLIGFCVERSHRLLVYEYMPRGSLDKWIYYLHSNAPLDWGTRKRIITNVARGLSYLHDECRQRIVHLDIKPHNILLDDSFNAKVADFGLSKLIEREISKVVTRMKGTPGYMAPEWLTSQITEKVDVYSFGVVVMEIISGRKNIDYSQSEENVQLITLLQEKAKKGQLEDLVDKNSDEMHLHKEEVIEVMKLAMWCLQSDSSRRPSMSVVVKTMEGERAVDDNLGYNFFDLSPAISVPVEQLNSSLHPEASILSAPR
ncbi:G-type lectin S-receptor-like serine/threonine-protein kinase SD2-5 [Oryza glaberrima]|uniref:G-type lectin S-receptor-like serine/threonine-protein kinase SD2-5 n=1 Tax=Oryza glaberrima TaxID=4538 RepID=UPI00224C5E01|nr:G-type lectin S-receptor-like serine/threonine-protein kinase SD2-5 [Oryza glaberrima]